MVWFIMGKTNVLAAHAALLPNGKILHFSGSEYDETQHNKNQNNHTRLYDCATGEVTVVGSPIQDLFCCGHALLADGNLLAAGGTASYAPHTEEAGGFHLKHWPGLQNSWVYDVRSSKWSDCATLLPQPEFMVAPLTNPAVVSRERDRLQVFWINRDGAVITQYWPDKLGKWSRPQVLVHANSPLAAKPGGAVTAVSRARDKIDIFWCGNDGAINSHFYSESQPWNTHDAFTLVPANSPLAAVPGAAVCVVTRALDKLDVFWSGRDGAINSHFFSEQRPWAEHGPFGLVRGEFSTGGEPGLLDIGRKQKYGQDRYLLDRR